MATGQAAGVCAALAGGAGCTPRQVEVGAVQTELVRQGADLGNRGNGSVPAVPRVGAH
jgi:hypothetical protein